MNIQIFGTSKCFDTKKAQRYFKERRVKFQLVDLSKYGISRGELTSVKNALGLDALINSKHPDAPLLTYLAYDADKLEAAGRSPAAAHPHRPQRETGYRGLLPRCLENLGITDPAPCHPPLGRMRRAHRRVEKLRHASQKCRHFFEGTQPTASHAQSAHACGLRGVFSDVHAAGKHYFDSLPPSADGGTLRGSCAPILTKV